MGCRQSAEHGSAEALTRQAAAAGAGEPEQELQSASLGYDQTGEVLKQFLITTNTALVRVHFLRERAKKRGALLLRRQELPRAAVCAGAELAGELAWWERAGRTKRLVFAASHGWMTAEHPDPTRERLHDLVLALNRLGADDADLVFFDFMSLFQVPHPRCLHGQGLLSGHAALRTPEEQRWTDSALEGMDRVYASGAVQVIVLPQVYRLSGIQRGLTKNARAYMQRGWCRVELSVAAYFGRVANPEEAPELPQHGVNPQEVKQLMSTGEISFTSPSDEAPVLEMYRRCYYAGKKGLLIQEIAAGRAEGVREDIRSALHALDPRVRKDMVAALTEAGTPTFISELVEVLKDTDSTVRRSAVQALPRLAPAEGEGRERALAALLGRTRDGAWIVRRAAVQALPELAPAEGKDRARVIAVLLRRLEPGEESPSVVQAAARALLELAPAGDEDRKLGLAALLARLDDWREQIRKAAAEALPQFAATEGEERARAFAAVLARLERDRHAGEVCVQALLRLAPSAGEERARALAVLLACLERGGDEDAMVAAVQALPQVAREGEGCARAFAALLACLKQERAEPTVLAAVRALLQLSPAEGEGHGDAIAMLLEHERWEVRRAVVEVLPEFAPAEGEGRAHALAALLAQLRRESREFRVAVDKANGSSLGLSVRSQDQTTLVIEAVTRGSADRWNVEQHQKALKAGHRIIEVNGLRGDAHQLIDECGKDKILEMTVTDGSERVRRTAVEVLPQLAPAEGQWCAQALEALLECLEKDWNRDVLHAAVRALLQLAPARDEGRAAALVALLARLEDPAPDVRSAAIWALPQLLVPLDAVGREPVAAALRARLQRDGNSGVRRDAEAVLQQLSRTAT